MTARAVVSTAVYVANLEQDDVQDRFEAMRRFVEERQTTETDVEIQFRATQTCIAWFVTIRRVA